MAKPFAGSLWLLYSAEDPAKSTGSYRNVNALTVRTRHAEVNLKGNCLQKEGEVVMLKERVGA